MNDYSNFFSLQKIYNKSFEDFSYCLIYHMKDSNNKSIVDEFEVFPTTEEFDLAIQKFVSKNQRLFN